MKLSDLLKGIPESEYKMQNAEGKSHKSDPRHIEVAGIVHDSRKVKPGFLFAAIEGVKQDGHLYLELAQKAGASVALVGRPTPLPFPAVIQTTDVRKLLSIMAKHFHGDPSSALTTIALTGTKGKTTSVLLMTSVLNAAGRKAGWIGTLGAQLNGSDHPKKWTLENTTPEGDDFLGILADFVKEGAKAAAFEASSHALALNKLAGVSLDAAIFTNLSQDHLD
ncbi:MAG: Mur ligase family protein, partial [bacterium]